MSKKFVKILTDITGSETTTKRLLLNCYHNIVKDSFMIEEIDADIRLFMSWLKNRGIRVYGLEDKLRKIDTSKISVNKVLDQIDEILDNNLNNSVNLRIEFNVLKLLEWMDKYQGINTNRAKTEVLNYLNNTDDSEDDIFDNLNQIFYSNFPQDYDYYEKRLNNVQKRKAEMRYKQWSVPKFKIVDKYKVVTNNIKKPNIIEYRRRTIIQGNSDEAEKLRKTDQIAQGGLDTTLRNDYNNLDSITAQLGDEEDEWKVKNYWKDSVYEHLKGSKPSTLNRNSLYIYTVYLTLNKPFKSVLEAFKNTGLKTTNKAVKKNGYAISQFNIMMGRGYGIKYKQKLNKFLNPKLDIDPLISYLEDKGVSERIINSITIRVNRKMQKEDKINKKLRVEIIWEVMKPMNSELKKFGIPTVSRSLINSIFD
jgi:hypothetical protein